MRKIQVNNLEIEKVDLGKQKKILHRKVFDFPYVNVFLCGPSGSGKTNLCYNLMKHISYVGKTKIVIVSTTHNTDPLMMKLKDDFSETNEIKVFDNLNPQVIDEIIQYMKGEEEFEIKPDDKYLYAKTIVIIDDTKDFLRDPKLYELASKVRHYKSHILILSQYYKDITPSLRSQLRYLFLFKGWSQRQLKDLYEHYITNIPFEKFLELYDDAVLNSDTGHDCLYVSLVGKEYRQNLNKKYEI